MWELIGAAIDLFHALAMVLWVLGLPFLFSRRWPRLAMASGIYAISFIVLSQGSKLILGECFLTTLARLAWAKSTSPVDPGEWFTVRIARAVFDLSPARHSITRLSEVLILITATGMLLSLHRHRRERKALA
jgi:hypothetical protein